MENVITADLSPCPFCGAGETIIKEKTYWTGMKAEVLSYEINHWCGLPKVGTSVITFRFPTKEEVVDHWNGRYGK